MEEKISIKSKTDILIALCYILDDFKVFNEKLTGFLSSIKCDKEKVYYLYCISNGKEFFGLRTIKKFYKENKSIIDTINKYSDIIEFTSSYFDPYGNIREKTGIESFYYYIMEHNENLDTIISVLERIKKLGFNTIYFFENKDFTNNEYTISERIGDNQIIKFLDNIEIKPGYKDDIIHYKTNGSNYEITTEVLFNGISEYRKKIIINSLLFDPDRLPKKLNKNHIFDEIIKLKNSSSNILYSLDDSIEDLFFKFHSTEKVISELDDSEIKEKLCELLLGIKSNLEELKSLSSEYEKTVFHDYSTIKKNLTQK